jgi:plastocyanin
VHTNDDSSANLIKRAINDRSVESCVKTFIGERKMKKYHIVVLVALAVATVMVAGCTSSSNPSPGPVTSSASQNTVAIKDYAFSPSTLTIQKGTNVTWRNDDSVQHQITSDSQAFSSPLFGTGGTYTYQFNTTGTFPYHCSIHPSMKGTVVVT